MALTKITSSVVAVNSLTAANIADNSIDATKIANNQILARHIANATALTLDGGVTIDNITIDGTEIDLSSGDLSIDIAGNLQIDADDNGEVRFLDGGTQYATIKKDGNNALFQSIVADGDFIIQGIDGSSFISAVTFDISEAGRATFNEDVIASGLYVGSRNASYDFYNNGTSYFNGSVYIDDALTVVAAAGAGTHTHAIFTGTAGRGLALKSGQTGGQHNGKAIIDAQDTEAGGASMDFQIGGNTKVAIDNSGRLMIGTTTEGRAGEGADMFTIGDTSNNSGMTMRSGTSGYGSIYFSDATSGTGEYAGYLQYSHANERLHIATGSSIRLNVDSDGLKFNNDTAAANALDDYEEGTWTPTINDGTIASEGGYYTKIGRVVTVSYYYDLTTLGSSGTVVRIGGLPYAAKTAGGNGQQTVGSVLCRFFSKNQIVSYLGDNDTNLYYYNNGTGDFDSITFGEIEVSYDNDFRAHGTHTYITS
tara:strand:- start:347 stop:1786 length:1440 start_codon:yes stop_codon:yes gene_type:complete